MLRVIKVGGSLFDWPDLPRELTRWLQLQPPAINLLIAGGGELCETVRRWDERFGLGQEASHRMCLELMRTSAALLEHLLPDLPAETTILDVKAFLKQITAVPLPASWDVTSDSLAAHVAEFRGATELALLKSTSLAGDMTSIEASQKGLVDPCFPTAGAKLEFVRFVNLRDPAFPQWMLFAGH